MSTLNKLVLFGLTVLLAVWLGLDAPDDSNETGAVDRPGSESAVEDMGQASAPPGFTPAIPDSDAWGREQDRQLQEAETERYRPPRAEDKRLSRMEIDNAVARATMGMHTGNPDVGFGTCRYTHNYSVSSSSSQRIRASAEFICTSRDSRTGRTIRQQVWRPVTLKRYGGSWVADRTN